MATKSYTKKPAADHYQEVTDKILSLLEAGTKPWECPWARSAGGGMPVNSEGKNYHGINIPLLWMEQADKGFGADQWMTYNQAQELGGQVRKGEKGSRIFFYKSLEVDNKEGLQDSNGDPVKVKIPMLKAYTVFNVEQIDNLPAKYYPAASDDLPGGFDPIETGEALLALSFVKINETGQRAFYRPATDEITLPERARFSEAVNFYATALHEMAHATGSKERLARDKGHTFGSVGYAFEELVAELGAVMAAARLGIHGELEGHASYIANWSQLLRSDKKAFFKAAAQAQKAADFIIDHYEANAGSAPVVLAQAA